MRTRRQKILEDRQAVVGRLNAGENSSTIPDDLISQIFLRLPAKSIARCRCLSKLWASIIDRQYFADSYFKISSARPNLLFAFQAYGEVFFFSAPQNQEDDDNSSPVTASYRMSFPVNTVKGIFSPISGLVCVKDERILKGMKTPVTVLVICNPTTGQSFTLPRMKTRKRKSDVRSFFGYDPVEKQYKVLSMTCARDIVEDDGISTEHQVLTLQTGKLSWRMIKCGVPHQPGSNNVCINGVLYYKAENRADSPTYGEMIIVAFDFRSEKFSFTETGKPYLLSLINFNGKPASVIPSNSNSFNRASTIDLRVLDDIEKNEWSKHVYKLPLSWENVVGDADLYSVKLTAANEVMFSGYKQRSPFYLFYYSLERETIRRVEIRGMEAFTNFHVYTFVDHVEDVRSVKGVLGLAL
ncbi:F-box protein DOR [Raphanus sativus]|uniref:F-box protein DOR-like n=1 Tax=Raphanus sativus TaxID=3726 RepID=A0A6J0K9T7_RAPSA|nr:F-box protein DOR-like [Raphanus sativus]KAJ4883424.1 F-box protein DOR [Raphanus sativus]